MHDRYFVGNFYFKRKHIRVHMLPKGLVKNFHVTFVPLTFISLSKFDKLVRLVNCLCDFFETGLHIDIGKQVKG